MQLQGSFGWSKLTKIEVKFKIGSRDFKDRKLHHEHCKLHFTLTNRRHVSWKKCLGYFFITSESNVSYGIVTLSKANIIIMI